MALVYAADLRVIDRSSLGQADLDTVISIVAAWAGADDPASEGESQGKRPGSRVRVSWLKQSEGSAIWRLTLLHPDANDEHLSWTADIIVISDGVTDVKVRLDRARTDAAVGPPGDRPRPPGCIRELMASPIVSVVDAGFELSPDPRVVRKSDSDEFVSLVTAPNRRLPIIAYTPRDEDVIDGVPLARDTAGLAHVRLVLSDASWVIGDELPRGVNVYGGAVRIIWPGVKSDHPGPYHPLWYPDASARQVHSSVVRRIVTAGLAQAVEDPRVVDIERTKRRSEARELSARMEMLREELELGERRRDEVAARLRGAELEIAKLAADRDTWVDLASVAEAESAQAKLDRLRVEAERDHWKQAAENALSSLKAHGGEVDEERELRSEIDRRVVALGSVDGAKPRPYRLGAKFMESVVGLGPGYRDKILKACSIVVANSPKILGMAEDHELRNGPGPNDGPVQRYADHATGRRIPLERNTPAARRLHYWVLPDGSVEFASVNVHDDMTLPER